MHACTQVLFGAGFFETHVPGLLAQWLHYHLALLGIAVFHVYDSDGSFEPFVRAWVAQGRVSYYPRFPQVTAAGLATLKGNSRQ